MHLIHAHSTCVPFMHRSCHKCNRPAHNLVGTSLHFGLPRLSRSLMHSTIADVRRPPVRLSVCPCSLPAPSSETYVRAWRAAPPARMARDPYVEALVSKREAHLVDGLQLATALRGKRVFFNGDSIIVWAPPPRPTAAVTLCACQ